VITTTNTQTKAIADPQYCHFDFFGGIKLFDGEKELTCEEDKVNEFDKDEYDKDEFNGDDFNDDELDGAVWAEIDSRHEASESTINREGKDRTEVMKSFVLEA